jgi:hypothetical protein
MDEKRYWHHVQGVTSKELKNAADNAARQYGDMMDLQHHEPDPVKHPRMSLEARAAQFSPFAALTGYEDAIKETARYTDEKSELSDTRKAEMDAVLQELIARERESPTVQLTFFKPDYVKHGGSYCSFKGIFRKIDPIRNVLIFIDGKEIPIDDIYNIILG